MKPQTAVKPQHTPTSTITAACGECSLDRKSYQVIFCPLHTHAVNSHEALLIALKEAEQAMSDVYRENKDIGRNYLSTARFHAREAIAQAEGKES